MRRGWKKLWRTRDITAGRCWRIFGRLVRGRIYRNPNVSGGTVSEKQGNRLQSTATAGASEEPVAERCSAGGASLWKEPSPMPTTRGECGERICADIETYSNGCSFTSQRS